MKSVILLLLLVSVATFSAEQEIATGENNSSYSVQLGFDVKQSHLEKIEPKGKRYHSFIGSVGKNFVLNKYFTTDLRLFASALYESFNKDGTTKTNVHGNEVELTEYEGRNYQIEIGVKPQLNAVILPNKWSVHLGTGLSFSFEDMEIETETNRPMNVFGSTHYHWQYDSSRQSYRALAFVGTKYQFKNKISLFFNLEYSRLKPMKVNESSSDVWLTENDTARLNPNDLSYSRNWETISAIQFGVEWPI